METTRRLRRCIHFCPLEFFIFYTFAALLDEFAIFRRRLHLTIHLLIISSDAISVFRVTSDVLHI